MGQCYTRSNFTPYKRFEDLRKLNQFRRFDLGCDRPIGDQLQDLFKIPHLSSVREYVGQPLSCANLHMNRVLCVETANAYQLPAPSN